MPDTRIAFFCFFPRHHPAGRVRIKAQLTVWVLERGPEIPLFSVPLRHWQRQQDPQYRCWRGRPPLLPRPSATGAQRAVHRAEFGGFWPLECPRLDAAVPLNPGSPAALLSLRLAWRSMRRSFGRLGSIPPTSWQRRQGPPCQIQAPNFAGCFADRQSGLGLGRFSTFLESTSDSSNYR